MANRTNIKRIVKTLNFVGAGVVDLVFRQETGSNPANYFTYNGKSVNQFQTSLFIANTTAHLGSYCLESDINDAITVDLTPTDTVKTLDVAGEGQGILVELNVKISRIRVYLAGAGNVEIVVNKQ